MKPYAAGHLLFKGNPTLTPIQCISYALSQAGVCTVVPGCKKVEEMDAVLAYLDATEDEKDYSDISDNLVGSLRGSCMYCNHCLPCPVGIDIATVTKLADTAVYGVSTSLLLDYGSLTSKASDCTECGICVENCPFGVDVIANMTRAVGIYGM
jgi:predicted aldo/keto reductase-like oxidoreductase